MKQVCFLLKIKKDRLDDYLKSHQVWPELLDAMKSVGIKNYSLFKRDDGLAVGYLEAENPRESLKILAQMEISKRWEESMAEFFETGERDFDDTDEEDWLDQYLYMP